MGLIDRRNVLHTCVCFAPSLIMSSSHTGSLAMPLWQLHSSLHSGVIVKHAASRQSASPTMQPAQLCNETWLCPNLVLQQSFRHWRSGTHCS